MRQVLFNQTTDTKFHSQASYLLPGHGTGTANPASNDENYLQEESAFELTLSVLANVIGGAILLAAMFNLPVILAVIWDI
jgi:hypothetical protein